MNQSDRNLLYPQRVLCFSHQNSITTSRANAQVFRLAPAPRESVKEPYGFSYLSAQIRLSERHQNAMQENANLDRGESKPPKFLW